MICLLFNKNTYCAGKYIVNLKLLLNFYIKVDIFKKFQISLIKSVFGP